MSKLSSLSVGPLKASHHDDERRFRIIVVIVNLLTFLLLALFSVITLPPIINELPPPPPPRLVMLELPKQEVILPPPPPVVQPEVKTVEAPAVPVAPPKAEAPPKSLPPTTRPQQAKSSTKPGGSPGTGGGSGGGSGPSAGELARAKAAGSGLLAMRDQLEGLRQTGSSRRSTDETLLRSKNVSTEDANNTPAPEVITAGAARSSGVAHGERGGIGSGGAGVGTTQMGGRTTTRVGNPGGGGGDGGSGGGRGGGIGSGSGGGGADEPGMTSGRSMASIKAVFDRYKGALYILYNRALRKDPSLRGRMVIRLNIAASGKVTEIALVSSELKSAELEQQITDRIRGFDFGAVDATDTHLSYPLDFVPS